ncbi:MAG: PTS transporter subunit EIIC [Treponema sp.]|jgi:PTS system N-acetylglucosamine-specific IIC component|nr:PTS transporter subunit EIIC [Treponema sp.]
MANGKKNGNTALGFLQRLGKSLMLPVAVLPMAAIFMGIGNWILKGDSANFFGLLFSTVGNAAINNMSVLFCLGVGIGMSKDGHGSVAVASLVSWFVVRGLLNSDLAATILGELSPAQGAAYGATDNALIGILCGLTASFSYNKFKDIQLPAAVAFFGGKRFVSIVSMGLSALLGFALLFVWPACFDGIMNFARVVANTGPFGAFIFGFFNRLLIPIGLHHALNAVVLFDGSGIGDAIRYWTGDLLYNAQGQQITGMFTTGFLAIPFFGLPAAALAMYLRAKPERKKAVMGLFISGALSSFLTGITEPLEFSFMFLSPVLFVIHALLSAFATFAFALTPIRAGVGAAPGFIEFIFGTSAPGAQSPWLLIAFGPIVGVVYFFVFYYVIKRLNLKTPGREDDIGADELGFALKNNDFTAAAKTILDGLGGAANIKVLDNCVTRLRIELNDSQKCDDPRIKSAGVLAIMHPTRDSVQIVVGTQVQFVADAMKQLMNA